MSLTIAAAAVSDFVASAWLVAAICTVADAGKSQGAVYRPSVVIVPDVALPPGVPFTLQLTAVSAVFATFTENGIAFPSITDPLFGEIVLSPENSSRPVPIRNAPPPLQSHFGIGPITAPPLTSALHQQIIQHASPRCCAPRQELFRRRRLRVSVLFLRGKPRSAQWQPRRGIYLRHFRRPPFRLPFQNLRLPIRDGSLG